MGLELSGRRVATASLRSRTREVLRSEVVAEASRRFDDTNTRTTATDYRKSEGRHCSALSGSEATTSLSASIPVSLTQITVVPPSTTSSTPLT
jgi:hypothetical protein